MPLPPSVALSTGYPDGRPPHAMSPMARLDSSACGKSRLMLKLPDGITTCLFDLDGVLTQTAKIHAQAWQEMFDSFLRECSAQKGVPFEEFDRPTDYDEYVDGKPRLDGVRS